MIETKEGMIWVPLEVIGEVLTSDNILNVDLRSLISVFDWDLFVNNDISHKHKESAIEDN